MPALATRTHLQSAAVARKHLATYEKARDLINIGAYVPGSDPEIDTAINVMPELTAFLQQGKADTSNYEETTSSLEAIASLSGLEN
jgi:flagellum-specific ATP synthase